MKDLIIQKLNRFFDKQETIILVLLYGSYARGSQTELSDVDIAVAARTDLSLDDFLTLRMELSLLFEKEIDLVDIRKIDGLLHYKVFTEGICIKKTENDGKSLLHKNIMTALFWYEDYYPLYLRSQKVILKKAFGSV
ncbi:type VII toxin-antitoxin system MntA family adenylyltransferase antitoxin [Treponema phagedenis]|uniref:Nucleotidyltransferase domain-containing protein n=1 Tax=Treponema phagedenis TaxID=162 RepID=A0AAE6M869_TREPH|nr:nucleotidyltransferase domain-containing protein [Treponema phagedenis]NVP23139.1 nucleotidyltransferase domain-containing protein [Treponema phagedenis]QEJ98054.1 nucleotidyltransferase domain-containing protein [Treponema phagedenis]QEK01257.1 nucleotidyltransferase domain-containing protein [Treponema phagedenis]QEK03559.1 nucleotidyltransferase domain-containing protein [Treponema phagedenis]QEK06276.1 nucleotidyltransferase domain-containing protein [Treponema phagedenis]